MTKVKSAVPTASDDPRYMMSLARGLEILRAFEGHAALSVTQAATLTGLSRSSAARCLYTLEHLGYVAAKDGSYRLRPALLPLARAYSYSDPLVMAAQPIIDAVRDRLGESSSLAMFDTRRMPESVIYVCRAETARIIAVPLLVGSTLPSYCTSMGRVLLAALPEDVLATYLARAPFAQRTPATVTAAVDLATILAQTRQQGWAMIDEELEAGLRSIAVPVRRQDGEVVAAINLGAHVRRRSTQWLMETALPELQAAAAHLARVG